MFYRICKNKNGGLVPPAQGDNNLYGRIECPF